MPGVQATRPDNPRRILIQKSPLAGFPYHVGQRLWPLLAVGQPLTLRRRPDNPYDDRAVEIWWGEHMLGHLPRAENTAVSQMMDRGSAYSPVLPACRIRVIPRERIAMVVEMGVSAH
ncbi:MAG: HIRAN domain-containing protein [Gammaproteobacteria bacterium]|nr:HIRAN domain-containing protein [Gammaproteobacteria bacterium]